MSERNTNMYEKIIKESTENRELLQTKDKCDKYDYLAALFMHSFSWTFMIMLIPTIYILLVGGMWSPLVFVANLAIHLIVDDSKANRKKINLIQDQSIHMIQIIVTWIVMILI